MAEQYDKDPLVELGGNGPSTLSPGLGLYSYGGDSALGPLTAAEIEIVNAPRRTNGYSPTRRQSVSDLNAPEPYSPERRRSISDLVNPGRYVPGKARPYATELGTDDAEGMSQRSQAALAARYQALADRKAPSTGAPRTSQEAEDADRAMLNSARAYGARTGAASTGSAAAAAAANGNLRDLLAGIQADSSSVFDTLVAEAGARGQATADSIGALTGTIDDQMAAVGQEVSAGAGGGLSGANLAAGATAGSQGVRDVQAALGGFLQQSQLRRTNATQDYIGGLEGQSQISQDRTRVLGEFMQAQQASLMEEERQRTANDPASSTALSQWAESLGLNIPPGADPAEWLNSDARNAIALGGGEAEAEMRTPGAIGDALSKGGVPQEALQGFEQLHLTVGRDAARISSMPPEEQAQAVMSPAEFRKWQESGRATSPLFNDDGLTTAGLERLLGQRLVVTGRSDPRLYQSADLGGGRGSRYFVTQDDYDKYLQAAETGLI